MKCRHCSERDETKLLMSTRVVNGRVETIWVCLRCYWLDKFKAEEKAEGEDGKSVLSEEGIEISESVRDIKSLSLQE